MALKWVFYDIKRLVFWLNSYNLTMVRNSQGQQPLAAAAR